MHDIAESTIQYSDWENDVIYHIIPFMKYDKEDVQMVKRKRHISNDPVCIVWSEHLKDFIMDNIMTKHTIVFIVIYPMLSGLFRV
jgi:hypothetical protein